MKPGIYKNLTFAEYQAIEAVNHSTLCKMELSPEDYLDAVQNERKDTAAFAFGRAVHSAILEPDVYTKEFVVCKECLKPDTEIIKDKAFTFVHCLACGAKHAVRSKI